MIEKTTLGALMKEFVYAGIKGIIMRTAAYEPNNQQTWDRVGTAVLEYAKDLVALNYLHDVKVVCNDTVNTEETINANEFHLKFGWQVLEDGEWAYTDFDLMPGGGMVISDESEGDM